ncbi:MAG: hypothetical protein H7Y22_16495 [Gemmatimonadaceae bacterium]|nr:hypothetical protein [Gloeobacterales cyanobacterium ES-bin-141]
MEICHYKADYLTTGRTGVRGIGVEEWRGGGTWSVVQAGVSGSILGTEADAGRGGGCLLVRTRVHWKRAGDTESRLGSGVWLF